MKLLKQTAAICTVLAVALAGLYAQAPAGPDPLEKAVKDDTKASIDRGLGFLRWNQSEDGNWHGDAVLTGLALRAFADSHRGYVEADGPFIRRPIEYLTQVANELPAFDPRVTTQADVQDAASVRIGLSPYADEGAVNLLGSYGNEYLTMGLVSQDQFRDASDVFELAHALMSLADSGGVSANTRNVALRLLGQFQDVETWGFTPDGASDQVTADATAMGALALVLAGVDPGDARLAGAIRWLESNYDIVRSSGSDRFYHYAYGLTQSLHRIGMYEISGADGASHSWRTEVASALNAAQQWDGHWVNEGSVTESDPIRTSVLAVHALEVIYNN
jgi:hypothetical protein